MALQEKQLGQLRPANTTAASLYSPASDTTGIIKTLLIVNTTSTLAYARVFVDDNGTTYDETTTVGWDIAVQPGRPAVLKDFMAMNNSAGNLAVRTDTNDALTFTAFGAEIT